MIEQQDLFETYKLDNKYRKKALKAWRRLEEIYDDYLLIQGRLELNANFITGQLKKDLKEVHSIQFRIKDPEHLIAKIITKSYLGSINKGNYRQKVTDLIGLRALHLFKDDWVPIHDYITKHWRLNEPPTANIRDGDSQEMFEKMGCEVKVHPAGYRSVHYLIRNELSIDEIQISEIQVRTIFEEGWSEVDHKIRYPYNQNNEIINQYLVMFNRLAGSADEMGSFIKLLQLHFERQEQESRKTAQEQTEIINQLKEQVDQMSIKGTEKDTFRASLDDLEKRASKQHSIREALEEFSHESRLSPDFDLLKNIFLNKPEKNLPSR